MTEADWTPTPDQIEVAHRYGAGPGGYVARSAGCTCLASWDMDRDCPMHGMGDLAGDLAGGRVRRIARRLKRKVRSAIARPQRTPSTEKGGEGR